MKILRAIERALLATHADKKAARGLFSQALAILEQHYHREVPGVEDIQDVVEKALIAHNFAEAAKAYILYRQKRSEIRETKKLIGVQDDLKLSVNAVTVLKRRYLAKNEAGEIIETPGQMCARVAKAVGAADRVSGKAEAKKAEQEFYQAMRALEFLPNSPTLMNAGLRLGQLSACFVLPVQDSIKGIFDAVQFMALIHQSGGGTGFSFSRLRPKGDIVKSTKGIASGPLSFMRVFDVATDVVKQGGRRRGANMGILRVDHPDILDFISAKSKEGFLGNFNLSVAATDAFMQAVTANRKYPLINPRTTKVEGELAARDVFDLITTMAWKTGDPGMIFLDEIERHNPTPRAGKMECTNPCGEVPLLYYESCTLGSINLAKMVRDEVKEVNWTKLGDTVRLGVHFLDNVIDINKYPLSAIRKMTLATRKIGLGVMGFAEMLIRLGIPYDSLEAIATAEKVMAFISREARAASVELGRVRGSFPHFPGSVWRKQGFKAMRNATVTSIAPTGTISVIAGCSSGIEPLFAISFIRNVMEGTKLLEVNPLFEETARRKGFYSEKLMTEIAQTGSAQASKVIPPAIRRLFVTALDIKPEWHVKMQAAFQKHTDNAVSKTVNLPHDASPEAVKRIFALAYRSKCKGITIYRYGSKQAQVFNIGSKLRKEELEPELCYVHAESEFAGGCPTPQICGI
jgi:ribonucleoside-diphosphate reductase alpha chain